MNQKILVSLGIASFVVGGMTWIALFALAWSWWWEKL